MLVQHSLQSSPTAAAADRSTHRLARLSLDPGTASAAAASSTDARQSRSPHSSPGSAAQRSPFGSGVASPFSLGSERDEEPTSPSAAAAAPRSTISNSKAAAASANSLNALLLGSRNNTASSEIPPSPKRHHASSQNTPQPPRRPASGNPFFGDHARDPAAIRAAAAALADRNMAEAAAAARQGSTTYSPAARSASGTQEAPSAGASENVLALKLSVVAGPSTDASYVTDKDTQQVVVGRLPTNTLSVDDVEVSGTHLILRWLEPADGGPPCWQVADAGSLNGTLLNGCRISVPGRKRSPAYRLNSDDLLQLGTSTAIKVSYLPRELLEQQVVKVPRLRTLSGVNAPPPPIQRTPSRDGIHRAPGPSGSGPALTSSEIDLPDLKISGYALSRLGKEHERRAQRCEDVIRWVPDLLPGSTAIPARTVNSGGRSRADRALMRTVTCEASPALQQFLAIYGGGVNSSSDNSPASGSPMGGSPSGSGGWGGTARRRLPAPIATTDSDKWSPDIELPPGSPTATEAAHSTRPSLDGASWASLAAQHGASARGSFDDSSLAGGGLEQPLAALFCVFDGHCGRNAADQASQLLPRELADRIDCRQLSQGHPPNASVWEDAFSATDHGLDCEDGCTATALLAWQDENQFLHIQTGNVGDSGALFIPAPKQGGGLPAPQQLTTDHRWTSAEERERLAGMGIQLEGRTRLYGLNLSRCLGDKFLKDEDMGLSAQPSMSAIVTLPPGAPGGVLILASDGLWDVADIEKVADCALRFLPDGPQAATEALLQLAHSQRSRDDVSIMLLHVRP